MEKECLVAYFVLELDIIIACVARFKRSNPPVPADEVLPPLWWALALALLPPAVSLGFAILGVLSRDRPGASQRERVWADKTDGKAVGGCAKEGDWIDDDDVGYEVGGLARAVVPSRGEGSLLSVSFLSKSGRRAGGREEGRCGCFVGDVCRVEIRRVEARRRIRTIRESPPSCWVRGGRTFQVDGVKLRRWSVPVTGS
ncbi:hypothetical protein F5X68DRAFT_19626 [Plectosphaerella plurivora]|uniref:Uncharacterized protein n=1 Tax=Plectosphaerella plurivora TaxID=936078 RepID=A0A9P9A947_9PEZI|nr:hypothetical protein F5X68DRAFT_19626 [Plectosphaerella plurivora]